LSRKRFRGRDFRGPLFDNIFVEIDRMNMRELTRAARVTERQVRYLIAEGFIPAPRGGRATAEYGDDHVAAIGRYNRLRELGFPPAAIKLLLEAREGAPFAVAPGITLVVDPSLLGSGAKPQPLIERIVKLLTDLLKDNTHADRTANLD
jgi:MerR family copper efflux transcriptional regulator